MGSTPTFGWVFPERTNLPQITNYMKTLANSIDATVKTVRDAADAAAAAAADAKAKSMPILGGTFTGKISGPNGTVAANYVTKQQLDSVAALSPATGQWVGTCGSLGNVQINFPAGKFSTAPRLVMFSMMSAYSTQTNPYVSDGVNPFFPAPTKDAFHIIGFPPNTAVRFGWAAWP